MEANGKKKLRRSDTGVTRTANTAPTRPEGWAADLVFAAASTAAVAAFGVLVAAGVLPWVVPGEGPSLFGSFYESLSAWGRVAFGAYMGTATLLGLVLPGVALAVWGRGDGAVCRALVPYASVLLWQVLVEVVFARAFFPNIVIFVGLLYTAHRIWQLRRSRRSFAASRGAMKPGRRLVHGLLTVSLVFWSANLVFLLTVMLPRVLESP